MEIIFGEKLDGVEYRTTKGVHAVIVDYRLNKVLTIKAGRGQYFLIGGNMKEGETKEECLKRGAMEEIGYRLQMGEFIGNANLYYQSARGEHIVSEGHYYLAELSEKVTPVKLRDYDIEWIDVDKAVNELTLGQERWAIKKGLKLSMRPTLTRDINIKEYRDYYWLKEELQDFCRKHGISTTGSKIEISDRVETFILTGKIKQPSRKATSSSKTWIPHSLSLDTIIVEGHRCSQDVRYFFKSVIPNFHFSTYIQNYFKENVGKTYRDAVNAWYEEEERKKDPSYKKDIAPQFEYNTFIRDYFADPSNRGRSRQDAIDAWNKIKVLPGSNKYIPK